MRKIGFTGTAEGMTDAQVNAVHSRLCQVNEKTDLVFHHGMCEGADEQFDEMLRGIFLFEVGTCKIIGHPGVTYSGHVWKRGHCHPTDVLEEKYFIDRNHDIVDETDELWATPKQMNTRREDGTWTPIRSGTWATIRYAEYRKKPVTIFWPDGTVKKFG